MARTTQTSTTTASDKPKRTQKPMAERDFYIILSPEADVEAVSAAVVAIVSSPAALVKHAGDTLPKFIKRRMIVDERAKSAS